MANLNYTPEIQPIKKVDKRNSADEAYSKVYRESFISKAKEEAETKRLTDRANTLRGIVYSPVETKMSAIADTVKQNKINMLKNSAPVIKDESRLIQSGVIPREAQETKKLGFWDKAEEMNPARVIPGVGHAIRAKETVDLAIAASRLYDNKATEKDLLLLNDFITKSEADKSFMYNALSVLEEAPLLASEIMLTGGVATAGRKAAKEGAEAILKKVLTTQGKKKLAETMAKKGLKRTLLKTSERIATGLAGEALRAPVAGALRIPTSAMEKQAIDKIKKTGTDQELESILKSATKAYGETLVEYISERSGGIIGEGANAIGKYIGVPAVKSHIIKGGLFRAIAKANPTARLDDIGRFVNKVGFNGVLNEVLEERVADVGQGALFSVGLGDQKFQLPTKEQLLTEFVSFGALGLGYATAGKVMDIMEGKTVEPSPELELAFRKDPVEMAKENITSPTTQQALNQVGLTREVAENAPVVNTAEPINPVKANVKNILQKSGKLSPVRVSDVKTDKTTRTTEKPLTEAPVASGETTSKPITVYRGEGKGIGNATLVKGEYFADSKDFAARFGKVKKSEIPVGSKIFNLDNVKEGNGEIPSEMLVDQDKLTEYLIDKGYDYTVNTNTRGTEYVKLNKTENKLKKLASSSKSKAEFTKKVVENWNEYRDEINRLSPDQSRANMPGYKSGTEIAWDRYGKKTSKKTMPVKANVSNILKEVNKKRVSEARVRKAKETKEKKSKEKEVEEVKEELTNIAESVDSEKVTKEQLRAKLQEVQRRNLENKTGIRIEEPSDSDMKDIEKEERIMEEKPKTTKTPSQIRIEYKEVVDIIEKENASEVDRMIADEKRAELSSQYYELTGNFIEDEIGGKNDFILESDDMEEGSVELLLEGFNEEDFTGDMSDRLYRKGTKDLNKNEIDEFIGNNIENEKKLNSIKERADRINSGMEEFNLSNIVFSIANKYGIIIQDQSGKSPYWKPKVISLSDRTNLVSFAHEVSHEMFYRDIYKKLGKEQYDFSGPLYNEMVALVGNKLTQEEIVRFWDRISTNNQNVKKAAYTDIMSEAYSYMGEMVVKNITEAKIKYPNMFNEFYVDKRSVFYNPKTIDVIEEINSNLKLYRELSKSKRIEAQITTNTSRKEAKNVGLLNHKKRLVNNVRYSGTAVRELDKAIAKARGLRVNNKDIFINNGDTSLERIYQAFRPSSERAVSNIMGNDGLWKLDPKKGTLEKYSDINYSDMVKNIEKRGLTGELGSLIIARLNHYDYENYKKLLPAEIKSIEKDIEFHKNRIEIIENSNQPDMIKEEDIEEELNSIKELEEEKKQLIELKNRIRTNLLSMPGVKTKIVKNRQGKYINVVDMTDIEDVYSKLKDKYKDELEIFDTINKFNLELARESGEISEKEYKIYSSKKGYSPAFREVIQTSSGIVSRKVKTNLVSFKRREGGEGAVYNPLVVIPYLHIQAMQAYNKNIFLSELYKAGEYLPDIISRGESAGALVAKIDGKRSQFTILDNDLMKSIDSEYNRAFNDSWAIKRLSESSRLFVSLTTGKNPGFALKNIFIDIPTSFVFSKTGYIPGVSQTAMVARIASSNEELEKFKQYFTEYNSLGGYKSHWSNVNFDKVNPQDIINLMSKKGKVYQQAKEKISNVLGALPAFTETMTRFTEYYRSRRIKGLDVMDSFENARNVSGSFHKKGSSSTMRNAISMVPYLNSSTQIMFESIKQMTSAKGATKMAQITLVYTLIQVAQALRMRRDYEEAITDEEKEKAMLRINKYLDRTAFEKTNYIFTKSGKIKIPSNPLFSGLGKMLSVSILADINPYYRPEYKEMLLEMPSGLAGHRLMETSVSAMSSIISLPFNTLFNRSKGGDEFVESFKNLAGSMAGINPIINASFALAGFKTYPTFELMDPYGDKKNYYADDSKMSILISRETGIPARNITGAVRSAFGTMGLNVFDLAGEIIMSDELSEDLMLRDPKPLERLLRDQTKAFRGDDLFIARSGEFTNKLFDTRGEIEKEKADLENRKTILWGRYQRGTATEEDKREYERLYNDVEDIKLEQKKINGAIDIRKFIINYQDGKYQGKDISEVFSPEDFNELYYIFRKISEGENLSKDEIKRMDGLKNEIDKFEKSIEQK